MALAKHTTSQDIELCYEVLGDHNPGPPIVLISGAGLQMVGWPDGFCLLLVERGHRVVRFDNRDCGESTILDHLPSPNGGWVAMKKKLGLTITPPYRLEDMARDVVGLLDGLGEPLAHVVGISLGGMIAQLVAIDHGDRVASLTCIASAARNSRYTMPELRTVTKIMKRPKPGRDGYIDWNITVVRAVGGEAANADDAYLREIASRMYDRGIHPDGMNRQVCAALAAPDRRAALARVTTPTLVLHGRQDPIMDVRAGQELAETIPGASFHVIEGLGHGVLQPAWVEMVERIDAHVSSA